MQFSAKSCQIIGFCFKFGGWRPRLCNPGSTTDHVLFYLQNVAASISTKMGKVVFDRGAMPRQEVQHNCLKFNILLDKDLL